MRRAAEVVRRYAAGAGLGTLRFNTVMLRVRHGGGLVRGAVYLDGCLMQHAATFDVRLSAGHVIGHYNIETMLMPGCICTRAPMTPGISIPLCPPCRLLLPPARSRPRGTSWRLSAAPFPARRV